MPKTHRVAIIGIGAIAGIHAKAISDLANVQLAAGSCRTAHIGRAFADQYECQWFGDHEKMLDEVKPDFVTITTPSGVHLESAEACLRRGIPVLCEKPLEVTTQHIDRMIAAGKKAGVLLGGGAAV